MAEFEEPASSGDSTRLYNIVSILMVALTVIMCCVVSVLLFQSNPLEQISIIPEEPTLFVLPTETPTQPGPTVNPSWTPSPTTTQTATTTVTYTPTVTKTPTPTNTPTGTAEPTASDTPTPTITLTPTNTSQPSPYDYVLQNNKVRYQSNFANSAGCNWAGLAGQVFDINGNHKTGLRVHITGGGIDDRITTGSNTNYGTSGWERSVNNAPTGGVFYVQLESSSGVLLSAVVTVQMFQSCDMNLALVNFVQIQE